MKAKLKIERAAGGIVFRIREGVREVLLIDDAYGHVTFPKGHLDPGEVWEDAAVREVREETGIEARILAPLSRIEYEVTRGDHKIRKQVRLFLMEEIDEQDNPVAQVEEINGAYFVPFDKAKTLHAEKGYANWSFILDKADVLWAWHEQQFETRLRQLGAEAPQIEIDGVWREAEPLVYRLIDAVRAELAVVAPEWLASVPKPLKQGTLPKQIATTTDVLAGAVEHTLLKPEASVVSVLRLCEEAAEHKFRAVCVNPQHIDLAAAELADTSVIPCVVIGFPLGATDVAALRAEAQAVVDAGAREVDMVIPVGSMREDDVFAVYQRVRAVMSVAEENQHVAVKVILEAHFLSFAQLAMASYVALAAGADFIKTSTGFAPSGAKLADVALMATIAGQKGVKAAGGVRSREAAMNFLRYGASRLGTSSGVALVRE
ncbi:deoxyribose-phosphate aldolase [Alicyclobacillus ferrooxydans]|uniref:Deoxyribose-phosphate aldolase n=1 Tax=Alicyclobacillus ferrooxydans TaxID=471514 RepID=A0A0P9C200_9BACL|nr:deoxyribose-phosphate aldolase [Alicyclobacillus ferrooxydans]KPV38964.1 hypothetical protein AN477_23335 [Alicyclobacillus ferrooxydans]